MMGKRWYLHCHKCSKRMVRVMVEGNKYFYLCPRCGAPLCLDIDSDFLIEYNWPKDVSERFSQAAFQKGLINEAGELISRDR